MAPTWDGSTSFRNWRCACTRSAKNSRPASCVSRSRAAGKETRSFCFIDDLVAGVMAMREKGEHLGIYHVGTTEEITIADLARRIAACAKREIEIVPGAPRAGGTHAALSGHFETWPAGL